MLRSTLRDEIRALAEIPGSTTMTGLINIAIQEVLDDLTMLARYNELYTPDTTVTIAANGAVNLPSDFQHLDLSEVSFLREGQNEIGYRHRLKNYHRVRTKFLGGPSSYRFYGTELAGVITRKLLIAPYEEIDISVDRVLINYWRRLIWDRDDRHLAIPKFQSTLSLKVASRICKGTNSRLSQKLAREAREAYIALRAGSQNG